MRRKILMGLLIVGLILGLSGLALAGNTIDVDQTAGTTTNPATGNLNDAIISQDGTNNIIDIDQTAIGEWNYAEVGQDTGTDYGYVANITQIAAAYNYAWINQTTPGGPGTVTINQTAGTGYNTASVDYQAGWFYDTDVDIMQNAGLYNEADVVMYGAVSYGRVVVDQYAPNGYNVVDVESQHGTMITQAFSDGSISTALWPALPAIQYSANGNNCLIVDQIGSSTFGLYQEADGDNYAAVHQYGNFNSLGVYQINSSGSNSVIAIQNGNSSATIVQTTVSGDGLIIVNQN